jgi:hypothetical protein
MSKTLPAWYLPNARSSPPTYRREPRPHQLAPISKKHRRRLEHPSVADADAIQSPGIRPRDVTRTTCVTRRPALVLFKLGLILLFAHSAIAFSQNENPPNRPGFGGCHYSDQQYDGDSSLMQLPKAPTHFMLMMSRYVLMVQAARGYQCTGTTGVGFDGHHFLQTGLSDDPGLMELVPTIARFLGTPLANTYDLLIFTVIFFVILIGYAGFWQLYPDPRLRPIGTLIFICLGIAEAEIADEYIFQISPLIAGIPWLVHFGVSRKPLALTITASLLAFCCSWCSLVRSGSLIIGLTFLLTMFATRYRIQSPFLPILLIILACVPSVLSERSMIARRNTALAKVGETALGVNSHPIWHTIYIGLGYIPNSEVPEYKDGVGREKVRSIDPTVAYTSARYQAILRQELWGIVQRRPMLVIRILAAKAAIIVLAASILLLPAWRLIFTQPALLWLDGAFVLTIGLSAMNGIVAVPRTAYLLTFLCLTFLYSSIKLSWANRRPVL